MQFSSVQEESSEKLINNPLLSILPRSCQPHWKENYSRILTRIMQLAGRDLEHASGGGEGKVFEAG